MQFLATSRLSLPCAMRYAGWYRETVCFSLTVSVFGLALSLTGASTACAQTQTQPLETPAAASAAVPEPAPAQAPQAAGVTEQAPAADEGVIPSFSGAEVTEDELRKQLVGKPLFLRGAFLGDSLSFTEHGDPTGHPTKGSFTLSGVAIDKVRLTKRKVEFEGARYGLHYVDGLSDSDVTKDVDRIKITPKKKILKITIDREQVAKTKPVKEKKSKEKDVKGKKSAPNAAKKPQAAAAGGKAVASSETDVMTPAQTGAKREQPVDKAETSAEKPEPAEKESERAADPKSVTITTKPGHAAAMLREAIDKVFAQGIDARLQEHMPEFWRLYFQAKAAGVEYRPKDPKVLRSNAVDQQAKVVSSIAPDSNEFAQANGISGRALYRTVIGADGLPVEIAVVRPIGFGLDEKAVEAIQKAKFEPAMKAGQPVAETLDLAVMFRIYSKRTGVTSQAKAEEKLQRHEERCSGRSGAP